MTSGVGIAVNYLVTVALAVYYPLFQKWPQLAALVGIACGLLFNFMGSRYWAFRAIQPTAVPPNASDDAADIEESIE